MSRLIDQLPGLAPSKKENVWLSLTCTKCMVEMISGEPVKMNSRREVVVPPDLLKLATRHGLDHFPIVDNISFFIDARRTFPGARRTNTNPYMVRFDKKGFPIYKKI